MSKIVLVLPVIRPPKCKDCKWSVRFNEDTLICTTFKVEPVSNLYELKNEPNSNLYELKDNINYCIDTEIARGDVRFCGYYGTHFEPKE